MRSASSATTRSGGHRASRSGRPGVRPDIQALRAIAVGVVVLYHLWPNRLTGGFVGVDVFFVISGFLIGAHLLEEMERDGRIRLGRFWARRAKRLLPASLLVMGAVAIVTVVVLPLSQRSRVLEEVLGSALYVQNWVLAAKSVDYLAAAEDPSPVQHFWTLSVEEQFYIALPLVLVVTVWFARRTGLSLRRTAGMAVSLLIVLSLLFSIVQTSTEPGIAYFSTLTRAWEFLAGVLLAVASPPVSRALGHVLGWAGLAAILAATWTFSAATTFPGWAAGLPVLGAVALLATTSGPLAMIARFRPVTWVGDLSYAIYLWHWPLIVLVPFVTGVPLRTGDKILIGLLTLALAWASTRFVEDPVRFSPSLLGGQRRPRTVGLVMGACTLAVASTSYAGTHAADQEQQRLVEHADQVLASTDLDCLGPALEENREECEDLGDTIVPAPGVADLDLTRGFGDCWAGWREPKVNWCQLPVDEDPAPPKEDGDPLRVLALGDSHNDMLVPAYQELQERFGWSFEVASHADCAWIDVQPSDADSVGDNACNTWRRSVLDKLAEEEPYDVIITTMQTRSRSKEAAGVLARGMREAWADQIDRGTLVVALHDTPRGRDGIVTCVEQHEKDPNRACGRPADDAFAGTNLLPGAVEDTPGSALVDLSDQLCTDGRCSTVIGNVAVYRDPSHVTATFARTLAPVLGERLRNLITKEQGDQRG